MATEQYFTHAALQNQPFEDADTINRKSSSVGTDINSSGGFDCNICLDSVQDPVVTLCGHLYCWPCIYKWIQQQNMSPEIGQNPQCPVCKADVSGKTLIPLYGRDQSLEEAKKLDAVIPGRPKGLSCGAHVSSQQPGLQSARAYPPYNASYYDYDTSEPAITLAGSTTFHPVISMFGEMICTRFFGNSQSFYTYPNSYSEAVTSSARARRQVMKVDRSLSRLSFFLLCCLVLCLVFF